MFSFFKKKESSNSPSTQSQSTSNNKDGATLSSSGEGKIKTKLSKNDLTKSESSNSSLANSPRSDRNELNIRDIPYDLLGKILAIIHGNRILTKEFMATSLVCKKWRALARLNGNHINLESFFKKVEATKMKVETIETCVNYFTYVYQSLEVVDIGKLCINNRIHSKYSISLMESIDKITRMSLDLSKVTISEYEVIVSSLKSFKAIKDFTVLNMSSQYTPATISLLESLPELETLTFTEINLENNPEDHETFVQFVKKNTTITKLTITLQPDNSIRFLNSVKIILQNNRALKSLSVTQTIRRPSLPSSPSSSHVHLLSISPTSSSSLANNANYNGGSSTSNNNGSVLTSSYSLSKFSYPFDTLKELNLSNMSLNDSDIIELAENVISVNSSLVSLDISYNRKISSSALDTLFRTMIKNDEMKLESMNVSGLAINDGVISLIGDYIGKTDTMSRLFISDCEPYWSDGFKNFSNKLSNHPGMTTLHLNRNHIETKCFDDLANSISNNNSKLRFLELSGTLNNAQSLHLICSSLGSNSNLVSLDISNCVVSYCPSLTDSLIKNRHLTKLNVNNCKLNQTTLLGFANSHLEVLDIGSNSFNAVDALEEFFDCLKGNNTIYSLNLSNTGIKSKECQALSSLLESNPKILQVDLSHNKIKSSDIQCIVKSIQSKNLPNTFKFNIKLKDTKIDLNKISNDLSNNQILID
ncbi:hypothetical protein DICPUDRAFT_97625 [Dictyostelium purpureum]|uniref:F-box domain-containing protein n=1 Tax=Dictyostelium purpureum TaxID=5786 RepID=F0ZID7_DICPU|nr:uncharacterized protein DICPUDRAFT_97625 [Dictyostelium purpureum]EGC36307.1 hypothetical protein DICPUDRAFT_97625 [Dictyostelium purpureum]|eukprot:XP_003287185.1 hypothetical protein DICPUDRAFT_97625 [Dictyostelium purpureum]